MVSTRRDFKHGILVPTVVLSVVAGGAATAVLFHDLPPNRSARIRKLHIYNHNGAATNVTFGAGLVGAFVAATVPIQVLNGAEQAVPERDIPGVEFFADITVLCSVAAAAPLDVEIQAEIEEFIGTSG